MEKDQKITIDDYNCEYRNIMEQGINLLRYGLSEEEIEEFLEAARKEPEMASFINRHMNCGVLGLILYKPQERNEDRYVSNIRR